MSCVSLSNELLELLAVEVELSVVALVDVVLVVLAVEVSAAASVLSRSDVDETEEIDIIVPFQIGTLPLYRQKRKEILGYFRVILSSPHTGGAKAIVL
jgi:hypothetical protein